MRWSRFVAEIFSRSEGSMGRMKDIFSPAIRLENSRQGTVCVQGVCNDVDL